MDLMVVSAMLFDRSSSNGNDVTMILSKNNEILGALSACMHAKYTKMRIEKSSDGSLGSGHENT